MSYNRRNELVPTDGVIYPETLQDERDLPLDHDTPERALRNIIVPDLLDDRDVDDIVGYCRLVLQNTVKSDEPIYYAVYNLASSQDWSNKCFTKIVNNAMNAVAGELLITDVSVPTGRMIEECVQDAFDVVTLEYIDLFDQQRSYDQIDSDGLRSLIRDLEKGADITNERLEEYYAYEDEQARGSRASRGGSRSSRDSYYEDEYDAPRTVRTGGRVSRSGSRTTLSSRAKQGNFRSSGSRTVQREPTYVASSAPRRDRDLEREERRQQRNRGSQGRMNSLGRRSSEDDYEPETTSRFPNGKQPVSNAQPVNKPSQSRGAQYTGPSGTFRGNGQVQVEEDVIQDDYIIADGIEISANTPYGSVIGRTPDGVAIVYSPYSVISNKQVSNLNNAQEEDLLNGPVEVVKFGSSEGAVRQVKDDTMRDERRYSRNNRTLTETRNGVKTTRYDREAPAQEGTKPVPVTVDDLVIDPFYYGKPVNEARPFDEFFNPGDVRLYSRAVFLKASHLKSIRMEWTIPLRAFNPYTHVAFIAIWPNGTVRDVVVPKTDEMDYLTHELRGELRDSNRLREEGIVLPEYQPATYSAHAPAPKVDLVEDEVKVARMVMTDLPMTPMEGLTEAERIVSKDEDDHQIPSNFVYSVVSALDVSVIGRTNLEAVQSLRECKTFVEVADRLVALRKDNVINHITFTRLDECLKEAFNHIVFETYSTNMKMSKDGYFVDDIVEADAWLKDNVGNYIVNHYPNIQCSVIGQLFDFELVQHHVEDVLEEVEDALETEQNDSGFVADDKEATNEATDANDDIFAEDNNVESDGVVVSKSMDDLVKEALDNENERFLLRAEHRTVVVRANLNSMAFGSVIAESGSKGGEYLPAQQYPVLVRTLDAVLKTAKALRMVLITNDGKQYTVSTGADNRSVIMAVAS